MASSEYNYDEEGETWPFFILALLSFILIPITINYFATLLSTSDPTKINSKIIGSIKEDAETLKIDNLNDIKSFRNKQRSSKILNKSLIIIVLGWATVIYLGLYVTKETDMTGLFDPYTILDVSFTASEKEIKSHYRKLSLKYHPDKLPRDLTEEARLKMEQEYIKLTSAYKALTDEVTRENFIRYGHPDGEQPITHGIALPQFLVEGKYSAIVVVIYFILIGILLPVIVGKWWNNVKSHTKKGLHINTAGNFVRKFADKDPAKIFTPDVILDYIVESEEINEIAPNLNQKERKQLVQDHFDRKRSTNEKQKIELIAKIPFLIDGLIDIATVFRLQDAIFAAEDLKKAVIQAVSPNGKYQEILQLPYVDKEVVVKQPIKKLGKLFAVSKEEAQKALGITDTAKFETALAVASQIPSLRIIDAEFKVPGEEEVNPHSSCHISIKFLVKSPKLKSCPEIDEERLKDEETLEYMKNPFTVNEQQPKLPFAYAPNFPLPIRQNWSCFVIQQKENKIFEDTKPLILENIDLSNLNLTQEEWIDGTKCTIGRFNIPIPTPSGNVGTYYYRVVLKSNAYYGVDVDIPVDLEVVPLPKEKSLAGIKKLMEKRKKEDNDESESEESDSDSDISDPEEDSLAGALAALRGEITKAKKDKKEDEEDDDEDEDVFTDIDTETEDES
ncbi:SEC63 [Candida pseudojiufengensis]|uniref:SEC63 n=1 Tax=Candida pseudojiufengensis TaxID=497109 RepID=UPI0022247624|nr:SEC63 [Candida pseudojiufengensis]KAI5962431.1 SEC63 [Candida pseudojiufengensis]